MAKKIGVTLDRVAKIKPQDDGVSELLFDATRNTEAELSADRVFQWHNNLFAGKESILYEVNAGKFREDEMEVFSGAIGKRKVHYVAPPPELLDSEMSKFVAWFNSSRNNIDLIQTSLHQIKEYLPTPCLK